MTHIFELLSGGIPGGAILLVAALIFTNLAIHFLSRSGLFSGGLLKKYIILNVIVLSVYIVLWLYNRPTPIPERIIVLPSTSEGQFALNAHSLKLAELFEQNGYKIEGRYLVHKWRWLHNTLGKERVASYQHWQDLANNLNPALLIKSNYTNSGTLQVNAVFPEDSSRKIEASLSADDWLSGFRSLLADLNLKLQKDARLSYTDEKYLTSKIMTVQGKINQAITRVENDTTNQGRLSLGEAFVYKGLEFVYDQEKLNFVEIINPDFEKAKSLLYPLIKNDYKAAQVAYFLGRMAVREQEYEGAEIFFKIAFSEELWNSDIYYYMSFLLPSRLEELGYKNRKKILERAVQLNPGNRDAVFDLADRYYITGNGVEQGSGTQDALRTLENYLQLNDEDPKIQSQLATLYLKTEKLEQARDIYMKMAEKYPHDSNIVYNLGIVNYTAGDYTKALQKFKQAIKIDNNLDAYLYAGITYEMLGDLDMALQYYRDRVRLKKTDDDYYAREAMRGIRKILEKQGLQSEGNLN